MAKLTIAEFYQKSLAETREANIFAEDIAFLIAERLAMSPSQFRLHQNQELTVAELTQLQADLARIKAGESVQYILGFAYFYNRQFQVSPATLIPRFDTEELVLFVLENLTDSQKILDLGTGSGIIAATLALESPLPQEIMATDISAAALAVAEANFEQFQLAIATKQNDLLTGLGKFDVIVSNPPYIKLSEKDVMDDSVLSNEPELALFAGVDGLDFYRRFADQVDEHLTANGMFFLEFGYAQKDALAQLFQEKLPNYHLEFRQDLSGHDRVVRGVKGNGN